MPPYCNVRISVMIPTYNSAAFVEATLTTVAEQSVLPFEVVVSDDGSSDETIPRVQAFFCRHPQLRLVVVRNPHRGPGAARNAGVRAATGDWIAFLDSDDLWFPGKIARIAEEIRRCANTNLFCHAELHKRLDGSEQVLQHGAGYDPSQPLPRQLFARNLFSTSAVVCRKSVLIECGLFDEELSSGQDYELWLRISPSLCVTLIREPLGCYIDRKGNITSGSIRRRLRNQLRLLHRHRRKTSSVAYCCVLLRTLANYGRQGITAFLFH